MGVSMTYEEAVRALIDGKTLVFRGHGCHDYFKKEGLKIQCSGFHGGREMLDHPKYDLYTEWWKKEVEPYPTMNLFILGEE